MLIVDSQVHIWLPDSPHRPWVRNEPHMPEPLTDEKLRGILTAAGVSAAVLVPPSWEGDRNDYALEAARLHPDTFAVMGRLPLREPLPAAAIERFLEPGMLGVRCTFHRDADRDWMLAGGADWFWPLAERLDVPVMVHGPAVLPELGAVAQRHPGLRLIIDHMGARGMTGEHQDEHFAAAAEGTAALARFPNVYVKTSGAPALSSQPYPYRNLFDPIKRIIDAFGPQRCFWGTDYSRMPGTYREAVTMFTEEMDFLTTEDTTWIMGRALATVLGWPELAADA